MLRRRVGDERQSRWTAVDLDNELNAAAVYLASQIGQYQRINQLTQVRRIFTVADQRYYDIETQAFIGRFGQLWHIYQIPGSGTFNSQASLDGANIPAANAYDEAQTSRIGCQQIDEREEWKNYRQSGRNDTTGEWQVYLRRKYDTVNSVGVMQLGFPRVPPTGLIFCVWYSALPGVIPVDDATSDALTFDYIPTPYHELVPVRAGLQMIGADEARYDFLAGTWNDLYFKLIDDITKMTDTAAVRRIPRGATPQILSPAARRTKPEGFGQPTQSDSEG